MLRLGILTLVIAAVTAALLQTAATAENAPRPLERLLKMQTEGNYKDAYEGLRPILLDKNTPPADVVRSFESALACLQQLNRVGEIDALREKIAEVHKDDWQVLAAVAQSYLNIQHFGYMVGGEFIRGQHRGGGRIMHATNRDRVRALQLFDAARKLASNANDKSAPADMLKQWRSRVPRQLRYKPLSSATKW